MRIGKQTPSKAALRETPISAIGGKGSTVPNLDTKFAIGAKTTVIAVGAGRISNWRHT